MCVRLTPMALGPHHPHYHATQLVTMHRGGGTRQIIKYKSIKSNLIVLQKNTNIYKYSRPARCEQLHIPSEGE